MSVNRARTARRIVLDRWASRVVVVGGILHNDCLHAFLCVIALEVYPLFRRRWTLARTYGAAVGDDSGRPAPEALGSTHTGRSPCGDAGASSLVLAHRRGHSAALANRGPPRGPRRVVLGARQGPLRHRNLGWPRDPPRRCVRGRVPGRPAAHSPAAGLRGAGGGRSRGQAPDIAPRHGGAGIGRGDGGPGGAGGPRHPEHRREEGPDRREPEGGVAPAAQRPRRGHGAGPRRPGRRSLHRHVGRAGPALRHARQGQPEGDGGGAGDSGARRLSHRARLTDRQTHHSGGRSIRERADLARGAAAEWR